MDDLSKLLYKIYIKLYRYPFIRRIVNSVLQKDLSGRQWVFILGCYNSGTTLLQRLIAAHPDVSTLPVEGVAFTSEFHSPEEYGWTRMWLRCWECIEVKRFDLKPDKDALLRDWSVWLDPNTKVLLEKSITNLLRWEWLDENFKGAYFIGIVRNGYAVSEGVRRKAVPRYPVNREYPHQYPIELAGEQWVAANATLTKVNPQYGKYYHISYEQLANNPKKTLRNIFDFLGLKQPYMCWKDDFFSIENHTENISNMNKNSIAHLSSDDIKKLTPVIAQTLIKLGYDILKP